MMQLLFATIHVLTAGVWSALASPRQVEVPDARIRDIGSGRHDRKVCQVTATVRDVFEDDIDREYAQLVLVQGGDICMAHCRMRPDDIPALRQLIGAEIRISGMVDTVSHLNRGCFGHVLFHYRKDGEIEVLERPTDDFNALPPVSALQDSDPAKIYSYAPHMAIGRVIAVWEESELLIRTESGRLMRIRLRHGPPPAVDETISVAGFPETCLFHLNLVNAIWKSSTNDVTSAAKPPTRVEIDDLVSTETGRNRYRADLYGETIVLRGRLISTGVPLLIETRGRVVPVHVRADIPGHLQLGSMLDVTGTLILDTGSWYPGVPSNVIRQLFVVTRSPKDVRIVSTPSWWTTARLTVLFGIVLTILLILLLRVRAARMKTALKVGERTRIAIELHDSVAQSLTGVAMELEAVRRVVDEGKDEMLRHLDIGTRTLKSCRDDLRNCLWDLRNPTIEDGDLNKAIAYTLKPHIEPQGITVRTRICIPRKALPDDVVHILLRIIRELAINAARHGKASIMRIAGAFDKSGLKISVSDNGCGFDPASAPGVLQGHFGLQGIRERLRRLNGTLSISRNADSGMHISFSIPATSLQSLGKSNHGR